MVDSADTPQARYLGVVREPHGKKSPEREGRGVALPRQQVDDRVALSIEIKCFR